MQDKLETSEKTGFRRKEKKWLQHTTMATMLDKATQVLPAWQKAECTVRGLAVPGLPNPRGIPGPAVPLFSFSDLCRDLHHSDLNTFLFSEVHRRLLTAQCITWSLPILDLGHGTSRRTCSARRQAVMLSMVASERREHRNSTLIPGKGREEASESLSRLLDKSTVVRHTQRLRTSKQ